MKKKFLLFLISLFALSSCGAGYYSTKEEANQARDYASEPDNPGEGELTKDEAGPTDASENLSENPDSYIEKFVNIDLETINYAKDFETIKKSAKDLKGMIENESTFSQTSDRKDDLKTTEFTIKIPRDKTEKFDQVLAAIGKTINISKNANNLKTAFRDVDKELEIKEKQLAKFNELLDKTNNIEDTLVINAKIIETQGELDAIKKSKADLKDRVTYDTYNIGLREVYSYDQRTNNPDLGSRIKDAMGQSLGIVKEFFAQIIVGIFLYWPFILIILIILLIIYRLRKKFKKTRD
ncbi:DUF4349 domain-containing protein [uncultured Anaerococcus sp.]|uniref:DUF4349 domain-containing protein n=1 Tax=uncultured Anaerococcus sp. TaxID=293428 RepID=UPI00288A2994|nr:DUF4349 domain-containing protein [uncultured Anaerococcus sp.]